MISCLHYAEDIITCAGELRQRLSDPSKHVVLSISQQSLASLAVAHSLPIATVARKLISFLKGLGVRAVFDIGAARELSLAESASEFVQRYKKTHPEQTGVIPVHYLMSA